MDLINRHDLEVLAKISDDQRAPQTATEELLMVLLRNCTPYLGSHDRVEVALAAYAKKLKPRRWVAIDKRAQ